MRTAVRHALKRDSLHGLRVALQGVCNVGYHLGRHLAAHGARLWVSDVDEAALARAVKELGAERLDPEAIHGAEVDVLAPCAMGAVLDDASIPELRCRIVAGGANNQLAEERHADLLSRRGILYVPDFVINAGGAIGAAEEVASSAELAPVDEARVHARTERIAGVLEQVLERARREGTTPHAAAVAMAKERIRAARAGAR
jgi:leucine dehydrogenase